MMILKEKQSAELERIQMAELEDRMHKRGHTDFFFNCPHGLTENHNEDDKRKERCLICGEIL